MVIVIGVVIFYNPSNHNNINLNIFYALKISKSTTINLCFVLFCGTKTRGVYNTPLRDTDNLFGASTLSPK